MKHKNKASLVGQDLDDWEVQFICAASEYGKELAKRPNKEALRVFVGMGIALGFGFLFVRG